MPLAIDVRAGKTEKSAKLDLHCKERQRGAAMRVDKGERLAIFS